MHLTFGKIEEIIIVGSNRYCFTKPDISVVRLYLTQSQNPDNEQWPPELHHPPSLPVIVTWTWTQ